MQIIKINSLVLKEMTWTLIYKHKHPVFPIEIFKVQIYPSLTNELSRKKKKGIVLKVLYHKRKENFVYISKDMRKDKMREQEREHA